MEIQKIKKNIIEALEGVTKQEKLAKEYVEAEQKLLKALKELDNFGSECNCDNRNIINVVFEEEYSEISTYCLNCGGFVDGNV